MLMASKVTAANKDDGENELWCSIMVFYLILWHRVAWLKQAMVVSPKFLKPIASYMFTGFVMNGR